MAQISESVTRVIEEFSKLPGIGRKSAERLAYHVLRVPKSEALALADAIRNVRENVRYCRVCFNLAEGEECAVCRDPQRDRSVLCVVEQPRDLMALADYPVKLTRLARGITTGSILEYTNKEILADALSGRQKF